jgi:hypothetical protein
MTKGQKLISAPQSLITYYLVAFFLLATVLRFPLRVRELFLVRWPRKVNLYDDGYHVATYIH